ncbi:GIY-YIG nuclease family protein [Maritalea sp. S77]|uniref:GIY-YIG nuclease family protein n=1 Tax=Maritalea sp. S77 TaxID=3415125 RepID=UPI003C7D4785
MKLSYFVYILAHKPKGAIYVGSARNLRHRVEQHRSGAIDGHTKKYNIKTLVYFEHFEDPNEAIAMEYRLKKWKRDWKEALIEKVNPEWRDVTADIPY